ncbi:MAG TPA: hypothetical protein VG674_23695 [Amycolatopsis sp.]|nr:hypothetical protein [Amycolatopsis sp.]
MTGGWYPDGLSASLTPVLIIHAGDRGAEDLTFFLPLSPGSVQDGRPLRRRNDQHAVLVTDHQISPVHDHAVDRDRYADLAGAVFVRPTVGVSARETGKGSCSERRDIADRAVDDEASDTPDYRLNHHDLADQGPIERTFAVDDDDITGPAEVDRLVDHQIVARSHLDRECRAGQWRGPVNGTKVRRAREPAHDVTDQRRRQVQERVDDLRAR